MLILIRNAPYNRRLKHMKFPVIETRARITDRKEPGVSGRRQRQQAELPVLKVSACRCLDFLQDPAAGITVRR